MAKMRPAIAVGEGEEMSATVRVEAQALWDCVQQIFVAVDIPPEQAAQVATHLVESDMLGHPSHGVHRVHWYLELIAAGEMKPLTAIQPERALPSSEIWAVGHGLGIVAAEQAMQRAIALAQQNTVALVAVRDASHCGRLGAYSALAARAGCLGLMVLNGGKRFVAPFGSTVRRLPPNPLSFSAPIDEERELTVDISTSVGAGGKAQVAALEGRPLPTGFMVDEAGADATDAASFLRGEVSMRPLGGELAGHKGFGLALMIEVLAGALSGAGVNQHDPGRGNGFACLAIRIESFLPLAEFYEEMQALLGWVKDAPPGQGPVRYPGEPEELARQEALNAWCAHLPGDLGAPRGLCGGAGGGPAGAAGAGRLSAGA